MFRVGISKCQLPAISYARLACRNYKFIEKSNDKMTYMETCSRASIAHWAQQQKSKLQQFAKKKKTWNWALSYEWVKGKFPSFYFFKALRWTWCLLENDRWRERKWRRLISLGWSQEWSLGQDSSVLPPYAHATVLQGKKTDAQKQCREKKKKVLIVQLVVWNRTEKATTLSFIRKWFNENQTRVEHCKAWAFQ